MTRDMLDSPFALCFTCFERHPGDTIDVEECAKFYVCICVLQALSHIRATQLMARDMLISTFVLCFTCFERHPGDTTDAEECDARTSQGVPK